MCELAVAKLIHYCCCFVWPLEIEVRHTFPEWTILDRFLSQRDDHNASAAIDLPQHGHPDWWVLVGRTFCRFLLFLSCCCGTVVKGGSVAGARLDRKNNIHFARGFKWSCLFHHMHVVGVYALSFVFTLPRTPLEKLATSGLLDLEDRMLISISLSKALIFHHNHSWPASGLDWIFAGLAHDLFWMDHFFTLDSHSISNVLHNHVFVLFLLDLVDHVCHQRSRYPLFCQETATT